MLEELHKYALCSDANKILGQIALIEFVFIKEVASQPNNVKIKRKKYMFFTI